MPAGTPNGRSNRAAAAAKPVNSLVLTLKLSPDLLQRFLDPADRKPATPIPTDDKINEHEQSSPASSSEVPVPRPSSADNASEADATSTPATGATPGDTPRRKGVPGPKPGNKRANGQTEPAKARGRPGPKKKPRLDEGELGKVAAAHRLGPKANTGAINAGLRALDRTGAPCRKWEKQPLRLRSFTGILWQLPSWKTHALAKLENADGSTVTTTALESGDSDTKPTLTAPGTDTMNGSSAVPSEKSNSGDGDVTPAPSNLVEPSSPAIAMAA
ncbi:unnamed protein product [Penicillium pancosmium]